MPQPEQQQKPEGGDPLQEFRSLAEAVMAIGKKYPEAAQGAAAIMKEIQKMQVQVAGNAQRTPQKEAPPMA